MCFDTEFSEISKCAATSVTRASPEASWRRILRRVSSARAIRVSSSCMTLYSPIWVNMSSDPGPGRDLAQPVHPAQAWEESHPEPDDQQRADTARHRRRHRAEERGDEAVAELAELVGTADQEHMDGAHAAAHVLGRSELHYRGAHEHAHRIRPAHH